MDLNNDSRPMTRECYAYEQEIANYKKLCNDHELYEEKLEGRHTKHLKKIAELESELEALNGSHAAAKNLTKDNEDLAAKNGELLKENDKIAGNFLTFRNGVESEKKEKEETKKPLKNPGPDLEAMEVEKIKNEKAVAFAKLPPNVQAVTKLFDAGKTKVSRAELKEAGFNTGFFGSLGSSGSVVGEFRLSRNYPAETDYTISKIEQKKKNVPEKLMTNPKV